MKQALTKTRANQQVSFKELKAIELRVNALPEGHNDMHDFLSSWDGMPNQHQHFRQRVFARIDELEEIHNV